MRRSSLIALLALAACGQDPTVVTPATFERPGSVAFVCVDVAVSELTNLERCQGVTGDDEEDVALVGLVTQTASGEVGAIDFRSRRVVDADPRVPGFTFTRVGEFPSAIAVPPDEPGVTYVAAYGSRTIEWYPTGIFLGDAVSSAEVGMGEVPLDDAPTDLVLSPDGSIAYVALPGAGTIVSVPILADRTLGERETHVQIAPTVPAELPAPVAGMATGYEFTCAPADAAPVNLGTPSMSDVRTEILAAGERAQPHRMVVVPAAEGLGAELLVADRELPLIHRFAIGADGSLTEEAPLAPGVPVHDLAVSPFVDETFEGSSPQGRARYLYAIDDTDQSVLVMDYDPASPAFGAVLPVSFGNLESDRLRLTGRANALDVIALGYDFEAPDYCTTPTGDESPVDLRGVFLAVGLANGALQIVDVVDLDGPCRGVACTPEMAPADDADRFVYIQRHRPRVANFVDTGVGTVGSPILTVDGVGRVADATTGTEEIDGMLPVGLDPDACTRDSECAADERCEANACVPEAICTRDSECAAEELCEAGACVPEASCVDESDCAADERCDSDVCIPELGCHRDIDCGADQRCEAAECVPEAVCTRDSECDTEEGEVCEGGACGEAIGPMAECPAGQGFVFGELVCATEDPWALRAEVWTATYEGTIPGTTELARMDDAEIPDTFILAGEREILCDRGVLGFANLGGLTEGIDPEFGYVGDTLVITTEPDESLRDECSAYFEPDTGTGGERDFVELPIARSFADRVEIALGAVSDADLFALRDCYAATGEFVGIEIRLEQAFLVSGSQTGFLHRVVADETTGACRVDTAGQPIEPGDPTTYLNGRAFNGTVVDPDADPPEVEPAPYQNPYIAFTFDAIGVNEEARLQINLTGTPTPFAIPVGSRPGRASVITIVEEVVYSPVDERLYVLDSNASALVQYEVGEFQVRNVFE